MPAVVFHIVQKLWFGFKEDTMVIKNTLRVRGSKFHTKFLYPYHMSIEPVTLSLWVSVF